MIFLVRLLVQKYKKKLLLPTTVITIVLFFVIQSQFKSAPPTADDVQPIPFEDSFIEQQEETTEYVEDIAIFIEVKGAVNNPGVYELAEGDRVLNAIELAGGYLATANSKNINHAQRVIDEMVIYVPLEGEEIEEIAATKVENSNLVNINKADAMMLTTLPGIGLAKAEAILAYREGTGHFKEKQDLMNVTGIGQKTFEKLEPLITVK
ncbi:helix-hairpin-helix domain-containing protein [Psychrobacillus soli]|uniref:Competence protein ComEA n=1 Tax=Psychrobacillus soli TaxID=1543965 RepID=A0A544SZH6_9BACI|nr:helix-hairpin-helix domain-containing protein [Psychrobacillus soli]TQR10595.1 competence protein ComEA [Psychrobacillus soli]